MHNTIFTPYTFKSGASVANRLVKSAMEESLGTDNHVPGKAMRTLYRTWAHGGVGTLITGNVMVHDAGLTGPRALVLDDRQPLEPYRQWAHAVHDEGAKIWMQINRPGRQVSEGQAGVAWAPSVKTVDVGSRQARFATPSPMAAAQIRETIQRFVTTAALAEKAGFDGVEIHAAHGYLLSQFLSPLVNTRTDEWGGSLDNRARLLIEIVKGVRSVVGSKFVVAVKLNSADFQRGGFDLGDAAAVIDMIAPLGVDVVELSGGSYESPAMTGRSADSKTQSREAYFLEMARTLVKDSPVPLMVTGGVLRPSVAQEVVDSGMALVGIGTALAADPNLAAKWKSGGNDSPSIPAPRIKNKSVASAASMGWVRWQMTRLSRGKRPRTWLDPRIALVVNTLKDRRAQERYAQWLAARNSSSNK